TPSTWKYSPETICTSACSVASEESIFIVIRLVPSLAAKTPENDDFLSRKYLNNGYEKSRCSPRLVNESRATSCSGCLTGNIFTITASTKLKIAVFAPMPSASESTATQVNAGFLSK